ncbi:hypothetical protein [Streptosporangium sp. CA-115845]|uniref:hypothetical protein n=1 Tax=Streptosporangium sp. CA-115845 TaxID=3240071 RepID=UPI003D8F8E7A
MIVAILLTTVLLAVGLVGFFADPLQVPAGLLQVLDQRASVVSMFIGAVGLMVAVAALLVQLRAEHARADTAGPGLPENRPSTSSMPAVGAAGPQPASGGGQTRTYSGDHIEFHGNTFTNGKVVGKSVGAAEPSPPDVDGR